MSPVYVTPLTPLSFLERSADVHPDKIAAIYGKRRITFAELKSDVLRVANSLKASGVQPGDRVAYLLPNLPEMLVAHFAVPLIGGVLVAMNTRLAPAELRYICNHSGAKILIADAGLHDSWGELVGTTETVQEIFSFTDLEAEIAPVAGVPAYDELVARGDESALPWEVEDELATISINYTSGTTGKPKGVMYTHRGAYLNSFGEIIHSTHSLDSVYLWTLPMFHCNGWCTPWALVGIGGTQVCLREVRGDVIWGLIHEHGVTHLNGAPTVVTTIMNAEQAATLDAPIIVTTAGAPPSPTTILQMEKMGFTVVHVYGLTETYGPYSVGEYKREWNSLAPEERAKLLARQGVGMIQTERVRVVDEQMNDVPADGQTMGEVVMRGNNVMKGYFDNPDGTDKAFAGGWFHSGDLGVMHPDGYAELRDRAKDVVVSGGENISTIEVEQAIVSHPSVLEVAVVGVPDEKWGERPKAFVTLRDGKAVTEDELLAHVRTQIARYKSPAHVEFVDELPKTSTGKIQKFTLRDKEWAGHEHRIKG